ncbi:hypothetical protein [Pedobacter metabolipauper]|uniref:Uncharacterized protein n=1 Tax=Pedobacter metabolipauper TaxID=425513 RepID=A0A4R6SZU0_9SPHI|nr:hypothetical protein [Pedobacter metabolipauper]TDQ12184.1 hypothetical protein ATK78_1318 [Pedobacter metabolipauper]
MDPYELIFENKQLTVQPLEDGMYSVYENDIKIADLYPEIYDCKITWYTADLITAEYAQGLGEAIYNHEL